MNKEKSHWDVIYIQVKKNINIFGNGQIDIEGAEKQALDGAKNIIMNNKPIIHLALNHSINDPYVLLPQILSFNKDYNFFKIYEGNAQSEFVLCK